MNKANIFEAESEDDSLSLVAMLTFTQLQQNELKSKTLNEININWSEKLCQ